MGSTRFGGNSVLPSPIWIRAEARLIGLREENAVLEFSGATYDREGRAIEFSRSYTHSDRCEFLVHFQR